MSEQSFLLESPEAIEGIGPERVKKLKDGRIDTIADMFAARAPRVRKLLGNVSPRQVGDWFCAATLMRVEVSRPISLKSWSTKEYVQSASLAM